MEFRKLIAIAAAGLTCSVGLLAAVPSKKKSPPAHPAAVAKTGKKAVAHPSSRASTRPAATRSARLRHKSPPRAPRYPVQSQPTPERYKQFQEALIAKGYLHAPATGVWDDASADAMRRFQKDQNLDPTGKPNTSLTIIALGLGPKY